MKWILILALVLSSNSLQAADGADPVTPTMPVPGKPEDPLHTKGAIVTPKVSFVSPKDGQEVKKKFKVKFKVEGMKVKPAGQLEVGTGHHHIIVDGAAVPKGQ